MYAMPTLYRRVAKAGDNVQVCRIGLRVVGGNAYDGLLSRIADEPNDLLVIRPRQVRPTSDRCMLHVRAVSTLSARGEPESRTEEER